jgi:hypothetical protein
VLSAQYLTARLPAGIRNVTALKTTRLPRGAVRLRIPRCLRSGEHGREIITDPRGKRAPGFDARAASTSGGSDEPEL